MTDAEYAALYRRLYRLFQNVTPLKTDCGRVCGGECCKGDAGTGMLLFPGERTALRVYEENGRRVAVCGGVCAREDRPLACRLFPFFPVAEGGRVTARVDPRAYAVCPLARQWRNVRFDRRFLRRVKTAGKLLQKDPACAAFMKEITEETMALYAEAARLLEPRAGAPEE